MLNFENVQTLAQPHSYFDGFSQENDIEAMKAVIQHMEKLELEKKKSKKQRSKNKKRIKDEKNDTYQHLLGKMHKDVQGCK